MSYLKERNSGKIFQRILKKSYTKNSLIRTLQKISSRNKILDTHKISKNKFFVPKILFQNFLAFKIFDFEVFGNRMMQSSIQDLYSSNKPGFIEKFNKWVDENNLLKGGLQK